MEFLKPNAQRAKNAIILIWIILFLEIIALISGYFQYTLLQTAAQGGEVSVEAAEANDTREQIIAFVYLIVFIISAITFIQWFRRAYYNLHQKVPHLTYTDGWAAGGWFIPIMNLFRPYQIMKELFSETKLLLQNQGLAHEDQPSTKSLGMWWALWIISSLLGQFVFRYSLRAETIDQLNTVTIASMISNVLGIPLAIITIKLIKDYSRVEPSIPDAQEIYHIGFTQAGDESSHSLGNPEGVQ